MAGKDDDDYMGDLSQFLPPSETQPKHQNQPSSCSSSSSSSNWGTGDGKRGKKSKLSWQEQKRRTKIQKQKQDDEYTKQSLHKPLPASNIGFKLLQQMGYRPSEDSKEPIGVEIRRSRGGLGLEEEQRRREKQEIENKRRREEYVKEDFEETVRNRFRVRRIRSDFHKAQNALAQLEKREFEPELKREDCEGEKKEEQEEEIVTQEDLDDVLMKLRDEHYYCLYCGCQYETAEELTNSCPGPSEEDH